MIAHRTDEQIISGCFSMKMKIWKIKNRFYGKPGEFYFDFQPWDSQYVESEKPKNNKSIMWEEDG